MATWIEKQRDKAKREKLARELTHRLSYGQTDPQLQAKLDYARVTQDPNYVEPGLQGGVPTESVTGLGLSPLDLIGTGLGTKAATLGGSMLAALGATGIASKASKGARLSNLALAAPSQRGIFAGVGAKTANLANLEIAKKLKQQGVPDPEIWKQTGWTFDTPDKIPRFEIPDNKAMYRGTYPSAYGYADTAMYHPELMQGYPDVGGIRFESNVSGIGGDYVNQGADEIIRLGANEGADTGSTALHELQHAIQQREGFARGGSPEMFNQADEAKIAADALTWKRELLRKRKEMPNTDWSAIENATVHDYQKIGAMDMLPSREARDLARQPAILHADKYPNQTDLQDLEGLVQMYGLDQRTSPAKPMDLYQRLAGEAEARLTQARMNMTPEERLANYPYQPEYFQQATGVPLKDLIVRTK